MLREFFDVPLKGVPRSGGGCSCLFLATALLTGCFAQETPLPPREALARAHERIESILREEEQFRNTAPVQEAAEPAADASNVTLWFFTHPLLSPALGRPDIVDAFNQSHPGVTLDPLFIGDWHVAIQKLTVSLAAGDLPDVALVKRSWLARLAESGRIIPLDGYLPPKLINDLHPNARELCALRGRVFGLPADGFCSVLYTNRSLAGGAAPKTWEELRERAEALAPTLAKDKKSAIGDVPYLETLWSAGGAVYRGFHSGLGEPQARHALDFLIGLRDAGFTGASFGQPDYAFGDFMAGRTVMTVASSRYLPQSAKALFPVAITPVPGKDGPISSLSDDVLLVFARHAHAKREAIIQVLDYLTGPRVQGAEAAHLGSMPVRRSVAESVELPSGFKEAYESAQSTPLTGSWPAVEAELNRHLYLAFRWKPEDGKE